MAKKEKQPSSAMCAWPGIQSVFETMAFTLRRLCIGPWKQVSR